jgi:hypothetical protein
VTCSTELIVEVEKGDLDYLEMYVPYNIFELRNRTPSFMHENNMKLDLPYTYEIKTKDSGPSVRGVIVLADIETNIREVSIEATQLSNLAIKATKLKINFSDSVSAGECRGVRLEFDCENLNNLPDKNLGEQSHNLSLIYYASRGKNQLNLCNAITVKNLIVWVIYPFGITSSSSSPADSYIEHTMALSNLNIGPEVMEPFFHPRTKEIWGEKLPRKRGQWGSIENGLTLVPWEPKYLSATYEVPKILAVREELENDRREYERKIKKTKEELPKTKGDDELKYKAWRNVIGWQSVSKKDIEKLKKDESIDLLLDEEERLFIKGKEETDFFKQKGKSFQTIKYMFINKGSVYYTEFYQELVRLNEGQKIRKGLPKRTIRHLNSLLNKLGIQEDIYFNIKERVYISNKTAVCYIKLNE